MLNKTHLKLPFAIGFLICELVLGVLVQVLHGKGVVFSSFACVVLACAFVILFFEKSFDYYFTQAGLVFTVLADLFLVVIHPMKQLPAMIFFSFTQICYFLRLYLMQKEKKRKGFLVLRSVCVILALLLTVLVLKDKTDALSLVSLFYYANLIVNIIVAFSEFKKAPLFAIGLLLFLMCDTMVGLEVMANSYIDIGEGFIYNLLSLDVNIAWIFYVPSQALISLSLVKFKKRALS